MSREYPCVHFEKGLCKLFTDDKTISYCLRGPCKQQLDIFDQFCKDYGHPLISRNHTGTVLCKMYGLKRKSARVNGKVTWIYIEA